MKKITTIILIGVTIAFSQFNPCCAQHTKIFDFTGITDGSSPLGSLISDGTFLYGMTIGGGTFNKGTIFKIKPDGTGYSKLLDFSGTLNGSTPNGDLYSDGTFLYGMTKRGGIKDSGVIFKIMPDGTGYSKLLDFLGTANGSYPIGSLISDGTFLYGMTNSGGAGTCLFPWGGCGVIFKIMPDGTGYSKLFDFASASDGSYPEGSLIYDGTFLYGIASYGGINNDGVIFKIKPDGTDYTVLYDHSSSDINANSSLIYDGTFLYGMTAGGGTNSVGTIFKIMPDGTNRSILLNFVGPANGRTPFGSLISDGTFLYGMTEYGGTDDKGTIFKIKSDGTNYSKLFDFTPQSIPPL